MYSITVEARASGDSIGLGLEAIPFVITGARSLRVRGDLECAPSQRPRLRASEEQSRAEKHTKECAAGARVVAPAEFSEREREREQRTEALCNNAQCWSVRLISVSLREQATGHGVQSDN